MKKEITDEILGQLKFDKKLGLWWRDMDVALYNGDDKLELNVQDENHEGILDVQREAYKRYMENADKYIKEAPQYILEYYKWHFEEIDREVELDEENKKETITAECLVNDLMSFYYLFICRDGSYGWLASCCWEDDYFAILLSESEPRIMTHAQLRNLHKINVNSLGLLVHDGKNAWVGLEQNDFFGKDEDLRIELEGSVEEGITPAQQQAYEQYLVKKEDYFNEFSRMMLSIHTGSDEQADNRMSMGHKIMVQTALPKTLFIDKEGNYGWICYTQWDDSYVGVLLSEDKLYFLKEENLRNYSKEEKLVDKELGVLFPTYVGYEGLIVVRLMNDVRTMPMVLSLYDDEKIEKIREAYQIYQKMRPTFWNDMKEIMLYYYKECYDEFETYLKIPENLKLENVNEDSVMSILTFTSLYIKEHKGRIAWLCDSPTDKETGLAFEFSDGEINLIGQDDII